jgi:hypothetical protein
VRAALAQLPALPDLAALDAKIRTHGVQVSAMTGEAHR